MNSLREDQIINHVPGLHSDRSLNFPLGAAAFKHAVGTARTIRVL
jgi:hypothetical protein